MSNQLDKFSVEKLLNLRANYWRELEYIGLPHESEADKRHQYAQVVGRLSDVEAALMEKRSAD